MNGRRALKFRWRLVMAAFYFLLILDIALTTTEEPDASPSLEPGWFFALVFLFVIVGGVVGMWFCWRPSRYLFLCTILITALFGWLDPDGSRDVGMGAAVGFLQTVSMGTLLALAFYSPSARLFQREREDAAEPERQRVSAQVANP